MKHIKEESLEGLSIADIKTILDLMERKQKIFAVEGLKDKLDVLTKQRIELQMWLNHLIKQKTNIDLF